MMRTLPLILLVAVAGCATAPQTGATAAECFSAPYDLLSETRRALPDGTRLILEPRRSREYARFGWRMARVVRGAGPDNTVVARWRATTPDSITVVQHDMFSGFTLRLRRTADGLAGTRMLFSDNTKTVSPGAYTVVQDSSAVTLQAGCGS